MKQKYQSKYSVTNPLLERRDHHFKMNDNGIFANIKTQETTYFLRTRYPFKYGKQGSLNLLHISQVAKKKLFLNFREIPDCG